MKTIFLDIDGTLVADKGTVPESAISAIKNAQKNNHKVILCTGRAMAEIYQPILDIGFDGIIACGGNYVETRGEVLFERAFSLDELTELYRYFYDHGIPFYAEANSGIYTSIGCMDFLTNLANQIESPSTKESIVHFMSHLIDGADLYRKDVNKISFLGSDHSYQLIDNHFNSKYELFDLVVPLFGKNSGEISIKGTDKVTGIKMIMDHYNCDHEHTIAMGDGNNDISMLSFVEVGVAMGNATDKLKSIADYITDDVNEDGLANAFHYLELC
jgi:Cof subfamily protein (haloacid dehalogenase superfamily)